LHVFLGMKKLKVVLVGCGAMSGAWLSAAKNISDLELVGLVDLRIEAAQARASKFGLHHAQVGTDLAAMLEMTQANILFDCTIPEAHHDNALLAFAHGVHVLGEKPLAHSIVHARAMVEAARAANCIHAVIQNRRFDPNIRRVRRYLETNEIGAVTTLNADFYIAAHFGGFRDLMPNVLLLDMAIHTFDAARLILNADPVGVYCHEWNPKESWYAHGSSAMCIFEFSDGSIFNYRGSWCSEGFHTTWESDWRIVGTRGTVRWDGRSQPRASVVVPNQTNLNELGQQDFFSQHREFELPALHVDDAIGGHDGLIKDFVDAVRTGRTPETVSSDNIKSLAMVFAAIESAKLEQKVRVVW
jgi:predicted dehydrogenase